MPERPGIRWDRLSRAALLAVLFVVLCLYVAPVKRYIQQRGTANAHAEELRALEQENRELRLRARQLRDPQALEREARRLGMVKQGERAYVISSP